MTSIMDGEYPGATHNPGAAEALRPVLSSRVLSKCRALTVACPNDHKLVELIRTPKGIVVTGRTPVDKVIKLDLPDTSAPHHSTRTLRKNRAMTFCLFLDDLVNLGDRGRPYTVIRHVQCECQTRNIQPWDLTDYLAAGRRRVVLSVAA